MEEFLEELDLSAPQVPSSVVEKYCIDVEYA